MLRQCNPRVRPNTIGMQTDSIQNEICTNEETIANSGGTAITPAAFGSTRPSTFPQSSSSLRHKVPAKSHPHQITLEPL
jgi:hypothetical protein